MNHVIFSAKGCGRCSITKFFMRENLIAFDDYDIKCDGKEEFGRFYRANRKSIIRGQDGVEFPVFTNGKVIRQGVAVVLAYLVAGTKLDGFIHLGQLHGQWIDGFDISGGDPAMADDLVRVLHYLKQHGLKIQLNTDGRNARVLEKLYTEKLGDRLVMYVKGPESLFEYVYGPNASADDIRQSAALAPLFPEYGFFTTIGPVKRDTGDVSYLTPEEIGETARFLEDASGTKKNPYTLKVFKPEVSDDELFKSLEPLPSTAMFKYRTAARRYQVMTEMEK